MNRKHTLRTVGGSLALAALFCALALNANARQTPKEMPKVRMTTAQGEAAALKKYPGGKIQGKTVLENEDGKMQFAVMVKAGGKMHEVMVNANTGKIESEEAVTAKEEATEKKAEAAKKSGKMTKTTKPAKSEAGEKKD